MLSMALQSARNIAFFYADPGSGALLWQLVGSFFLGLLFYGRRFAAWVSPARGEQPAKDATGDRK